MLLQLVWWSVAVHFIVSMVMVWLAVQLVAAAGDGGGPARPLVPRAVRGLIATSTAVLAALLVAGTFVTAAGPHAGDARTPRLDLPVPALAQLHADLLFAYLGMLVALGFTLRAVAAPPELGRRYALLVATVVAQGALGAHPVRVGRPRGLGFAARAGRRARDGRRRRAVGGHDRACPAQPRSPPQRNWPPPGHDRGVRAIQITENGGPEVLNVVELPAPEAGPGEVLVEVGAAGVNYIDTYQREGSTRSRCRSCWGWRAPDGHGRRRRRRRHRVGDRVAWTNTLGSYAEQVAVPADEAVPVPDGVADDLGGRRVAAGHDRLDPRPPDLPRAAGRRRARARRGGRRRAAAHPARHRARRQGDRHRLDRREGASSPGPQAPPTCSATPTTWPSRSATSPTASAWRRPTTASASRRSTPAWTPCAAAACSCSSARRAGPCRRSTRSGSTRAARSTSPARRCSTTSPPARSCSPPRAASTRRWPTAAWTSASAHRYPLDEARKAHEDLQARRTTGKLVLIP